jgi:hypothetical protein
VSPLQQLQLDIFGRLSGADYFSDIALYLIRPRSRQEATLIQTNIEKALAGMEKKNGKAGVACRVEMPFIDVEKPELPGPYTAIVATIRVIENPLVNMSSAGTEKSAEDIGSEVLSELHHWVPWGSGNIQRALFAERRALEPVDELIAEGKIAYDATLRTRREIAPEPRADMPTITVATGTITIASMASSQTYYTLNGSFPWNGNAILYSVPFTAPASGSQVRAVTYKAGLQASNVASLTIQ